MRDQGRRASGGTAWNGWASLTVPAGDALSGVVAAYTEFREHGPHPIDRVEPAGVLPVLIVEFEAPLLVADVAEHASPRTWQSFGAGPSQGPTRTRHAGAQHCVEVRLSAFGLYRMTGVAMSEVNNRVVGLDDLFGRGGRELPERLAAETDGHRRFDVLDAMLTRLAAEGPEPDPEVAYAWRLLERTGGAVPIGAILTETGWSRARLARRFREQVGTTPKTAARVLRFGRAVELLTAPEPGSLAAIAATCGYYDQAHLNRDFQEFAGCSPTRWIANRDDVAPSVGESVDR